LAITPVSQPKKKTCDELLPCRISQKRGIKETQVRGKRGGKINGRAMRSAELNGTKNLLDI
jgi:hypothetical protein